MIYKIFIQRRVVGIVVVKICSFKYFPNYFSLESFYQDCKAAIGSFEH